jgi:glutamate/tyrosine decarboxylase-like PLP-dependent enzyme
MNDELPPPAPALFPNHAERIRLDDFLTRELPQANARIAQGSVVPTFDVAAFKRELAAFDFQAPQPLEELLSWSMAQLEHGIVHMTHPRYFGLFNPAPSFPAECADRIAGAFNPQLATWTTAPAAVEIESHVVKAVALRAGLPAESTGHCTSGGSEANCTALLCALTRADPGFATNGARAFSGPPVFYISQDSHLAWLKIAHQTGIGRAAARLVATDGHGRLNPRALEETIREDRARGAIPVMVVATAGTTTGGMIDPLVRCAEIAREQALWYHVDAAWGGALLAAERLRSALRGIELADSITIDAHKWFATTMGCGMFMTRHPAVLPAVFHVATSFMPSNNAHVDPYVTTAQWSRRFLGLRLFLSLATAGWEGYAAHVERAIKLMALLKEELEKRGWAIANDSPLALLCVDARPEFGEMRPLVSRIVASGRAWVAAAKFEGRDVMRICLTHGEASQEDIFEFVRALSDAQ